MFSFHKRNNPSPELLLSTLHDEKTFYNAFLKDLASCKTEVIIESPYISSKRMRLLTPIFQSLIKTGVKVFIITRNPSEHEANLAKQAEVEIRNFERLGVQVLLCTGTHHRKLAILDKRILWEGSLNILSQTRSREIMRRISSQKLALEMFQFLKLGRFI